MVLRWQEKEKRTQWLLHEGDPIKTIQLTNFSLVTATVAFYNQTERGPPLPTDGQIRSIVIKSAQELRF